MSKVLGLRWAALGAGLLLGLLCLAPDLPAREKKPQAPEQFSSLSFVVLRESNGKPIKNASVVIHFLRPNGDEESDGFELKTDGEGRAAMQDIPYGTVRLQVIAPRLQTYGDDVEIHLPQQEFVIRLKPPAAQVSAE